MPAPFPVKAVANAILEKAFSERAKVSPLKLQKLLYYAHGYYSAAAARPLVDQAFEAWSYGPVVPAAYHEFKEFGNCPITRLATEFDRSLDDDIPVSADFDDPAVRRVIDYVWKEYSCFSAEELSGMTHRPDTPWDRTRQENVFGLKNANIPQKYIEQYFQPLVKTTAV